MTDRNPPWHDPALPVEARVDALLAELTLAELVGQLHQPANVDVERDAALLAAGGIGSTLHASGATAGNVSDEGVSRIQVDRVQRAAMGSSRLGIPLLVARDVIHGHRTVGPIPLGLGATFDENLARDLAARAALEAAADGIAWTFAPMLDLVDDPRWGRVAESFGESPLLTARLGAAAVRGFQASGRVTACAKHYVGYGLSRGGRDYARADIGEVALRNRHLVPFRAAVRAGVGTVMAAFCDVDGVPMHSHHHLLREVLKNEWGFDGVVVADWNGIGELVEHGVATDLREAARLAIEAGVDVDMVSGAYAAHLVELVESGAVERSVVEDAARRVLGLKVRLGLLDPGCPSLPDSAEHLQDTGDGSCRPSKPDEVTTHPEPAGSHALGIDRELARRAAVAATVVLQDNGTLPLTFSGDEPVLLTGPFASEQRALLGTWVLDGDPSEVAPIAPALVSAVEETLGTEAAARLIIDDGSFADHTVRLSREAGTTIALVGEHPWRSGEDGSISELGLPPGQLEVLRSIARLGSRLVVVVFAGRPLALGEVLELADAVILAWHPGTEAGPALADVLLGRAEAGGRLPMSLPRSVGHVPITYAEPPSGRPLPEDARGRGRYIDSPTAPLLPFGSGATRVGYGPLRAGTAQLDRPDGVARLAVTLTNPTDRPAREPVLLFLRDEVAEVTRPFRELVDLQVVDVPAHGSLEVTFALPVEAFGYHGRDRTFRVDAGRVVLTVGWPRPDASSVSLDVT